MHQDDNTTAGNIAATLAKVLPTAVIVHPTAPVIGDTLQIAVPKAFDLKTIDTEHLLPNPRRTKATASFADVDSFLAYVARHKIVGSTVAWCNFNPQSFALDFSAVIDDHAAAGIGGWRSHKATFKPELSAEWKVWKAEDRKAMGQIEFAEWIQEHDTDINSNAGDGFPTSLAMMKMATEFVANEERKLSSTVKLQSGGVRLTYIADPDKGTEAHMQMFEKFALGMPVFHGCSAWRIDARLKYRNNSGKLAFIYELIRADRVHEAAAKELVGKVKAGLGEDVPLFMGSLS